MYNTNGAMRMKRMDAFEFYSYHSYEFFFVSQLVNNSQNIFFLDNVIFLTRNLHFVISIF